MQTYKILEQDSVLLSQPLLIQHFGRAGAQFLSQLHYWLEKNNTSLVHNGRKWIYNTEAQWSEQLKLSARQIRRYISTFVSEGIIFVEKLHPHKSIRTNYYTIDYEKLDSLLDNKNQKNLIIGGNSHKDILTGSQGHNGPLYIQKITNKEINKSKRFSDQQVKQVRQHSKVIVKKEKKINPDQFLIMEKSKDEHFTTRNLTAQNMLEVWNEILENKAKSAMSKELAPLLVSAYQKKFLQNIQQWRTYCEQIKSSSYLMGKEFQLSIFWALKFVTIDRIRVGGLGVKITALKEQVVNEDQVKQMIEALDESIKAKIERLKIAQKIGAPAYCSWFHHAQFVEVKDGGVRMKAPTPFVENYWETHFEWILKN